MTLCSDFLCHRKIARLPKYPDRDPWVVQGTPLVVPCNRADPWECECWVNFKPWGGGGCPPQVLVLKLLLLASPAVNYHSTGCTLRPKLRMSPLVRRQTGAHALGLSITPSFSTGGELSTFTPSTASDLGPSFTSRCVWPPFRLPPGPGQYII